MRRSSLLLIATAWITTACGARSDLSARGVSDAGAGGGGGPPAPPACLHDDGPVLLASGLSDPYALGGDATSLFIGQLEKDRPLYRLPKAGGTPTVLVDHVNFIPYLTVHEGMV